VVATGSSIGGRVAGRRGRFVSMVIGSPLPWCWWHPRRLLAVVLPLLGRQWGD
jgi:hypothetical protein